MGEHHPNIRRAQGARGTLHGRRPAHFRRDKGSFVNQVIGACLAVVAITFAIAPDVRSSWTMATQPPDKVDADERSAYYPNCDAARAAGVAPIHRGSPGYREGLDGDSDGVACEPYR